MPVAMKVAASLARPAVDLRRLLPDVREQGWRPLCVPFVVSTMHEAARALRYAATADCLAVEPIWQHCVDNGRAGVDGTTIPDAAEALHHRGQPAETAWPYNDGLGAGTEPEPMTAAGVDWHCANLADVPLAHDGVEELIELALSAGFPVGVLVEITAEFEWPNADGEIEVPLITSPLGDYHAVVAVGAATSTDGTTRRLLVRNSWGAGWGAGGYGWLPIEYLTAFAVEAAVLDPRTMLTY
jgi:hypothetical protein